MITVKSNVTNRIALWQKHPDHPGGEVFVAGDIVAEVAETDEVLVRLANGFIVETEDAITSPMDGYDGMSEEDILAAMADYGETGVVVVRQYEAQHLNRPAIMGFVAERSLEPEAAPPEFVPEEIIIDAPESAEGE